MSNDAPFEFRPAMVTTGRTQAHLPNHVGPNARAKSRVDELARALVHVDSVVGAHIYMLPRFEGEDYIAEYSDDPMPESLMQAICLAVDAASKEDNPVTEAKGSIGDLGLVFQHWGTLVVGVAYISGTPGVKSLSRRLRQLRKRLDKGKPF